MTPAPGEPKEEGKGPRCPECGYCDILPIEDSPTDRPVAANKTMGREFARVETIAEGVHRVMVGEYVVRTFDCATLDNDPQGYYAKKYASDLADILNTAHAQAVESALEKDRFSRAIAHDVDRRRAVESAVKELKAERDEFKTVAAKMAQALTLWRIYDDHAGDCEDCDDEAPCEEMLEALAAASKSLDILCEYERIRALAPKGESKGRKYPSWVCKECAETAGGRIPEDHCYTMHEDKCGVCGEVKAVTEPRDYGYPEFKRKSNG